MRINSVIRKLATSRHLGAGPKQSSFSKPITRQNKRVFTNSREQTGRSSAFIDMTRTARAKPSKHTCEQTYGCVRLHCHPCSARMRDGLHTHTVTNDLFFVFFFFIVYDTMTLDVIVTFSELRKWVEHFLFANCSLTCRSLTLRLCLYDSFVSTLSMFFWCSDIFAGFVTEC